jgi:hypothetical protein
MKFKYGKVVFGHKDTYSAEPVLSNIIADWLQKFRDTLYEHRDKDYIGCPQRILSDYFVHKSEYTDDEVKAGLNKWLTLVDEMIYAFRNVEPEYNGGWIEGEGHGKETEEGMFQWRMSPKDEQAYETYRYEYDKHYQRVKRGRELFAKYYDDLWW